MPSPSTAFHRLHPRDQANQVAVNLRRARRDKGWSMVELHRVITDQARGDPRAVPISLSYIGEIERQAKNPRIAVVCTIAKALDIDPAMLFR